MTIDFTNLTSHPDWVHMAVLLQKMEAQAVDKLKSRCDPEANQYLIAISRVKAEISARSRNPHLWKVPNDA